MTTRKFTYYGRCVSWPLSQVPALIEMVDDARQITRETFRRHVDRADRERLEQRLGYELHPALGLTCAGDYCVSYHSSKLHGRRVYFVTHSAIEYVFTKAA